MRKNFKLGGLVKGGMIATVSVLIYIFLNWIYPVKYGYLISQVANFYLSDLIIFALIGCVVGWILEKIK